MTSSLTEVGGGDGEAGAAGVRLTKFGSGLTLGGALEEEEVEGGLAFGRGATGREEEGLSDEVLESVRFRLDEAFLGLAEPEQPQSTPGVSLQNPTEGDDPSPWMQKELENVPDAVRPSSPLLFFFDPSPPPPSASWDSAFLFLLSSTPSFQVLTIVLARSAISLGTTQQDQRGRGKDGSRSEGTTYGVSCVRSFPTATPALVAYRTIKEHKPRKRKLSALEASAG